MIARLSFLYDRMGSRYVGIEIAPEVVQPYLQQLQTMIGDEDYAAYTHNQQTRDAGTYHLTVMNVPECKRIESNPAAWSRFQSEFRLHHHPSHEPPSEALDYVIHDLHIRGIGTATKAEHTAFFLVCQSAQLDAIRAQYRLSAFDFHITLGFKSNDVHGVAKNKVIGE
jgi:hypothetical protein